MRDISLAAAPGTGLPDRGHATRWAPARPGPRPHQPRHPRPRPGPQSEPPHEQPPRGSQTRTGSGAPTRPNPGTGPAATSTTTTATGRSAPQTRPRSAANAPTTTPPRGISAPPADPHNPSPPRTPGRAPPCPRDRAVIRRTLDGCRAVRPGLLRRRPGPGRCGPPGWRRPGSQGSGPARSPACLHNLTGDGESGRPYPASWSLPLNLLQFIRSGDNQWDARVQVCAGLVSRTEKDSWKFCKLVTFRALKHSVPAVWTAALRGLP